MFELVEELFDGCEIKLKIYIIVSSYASLYSLEFCFILGS